MVGCVTDFTVNECTHKNQLSRCTNKFISVCQSPVINHFYLTGIVKPFKEGKRP